MVDLSRVMWAIDNLAEKSIEKTKYESKSVDSMSIEEKLNAIKVILYFSFFDLLLYRFIVLNNFLCILFFNIQDLYTQKERSH